VKQNKIIIFMITLAILPHGFLTSHEKTKNFPVLKGPYLGQKPPGSTPEIFAPGHVCTDLDEYGCTFSPDGRKLFFGRKMDIYWVSTKAIPDFTEKK
jgi:hypothetical protein